jgi:hypothetical protein
MVSIDGGTPTKLADGGGASLSADGGLMAFTDSQDSLIVCALPGCMSRRTIASVQFDTLLCWTPNDIVLLRGLSDDVARGPGGLSGDSEQLGQDGAALEVFAMVATFVCLPEACATRRRAGAVGKEDPWLVSPLPLVRRARASCV